jgi:GDP-L-fucose synthase
MIMPTQLFDVTGRRIYVAGHLSMAGSSIVRLLDKQRCKVITATPEAVKLERQNETEMFLASRRPDIVVIAAGKVGGTPANKLYPAEVMRINLSIALNIIKTSHRLGVSKLLYLASSCIYPRLAQQPMGEKELLSGPLEPSTESFAIAEIAAIKLCQAYRREYGDNFISLTPPTVYGPGDTYDSEDSPIIAALIRRLHQAKIEGVSSVTVWSTGAQQREFLYVDDLAEACWLALQYYSTEEHLNVGSGEEVTITELVRIIAKVVGYRGEITFDQSKPECIPRRLLDSTRLLALGWRPRVSLRTGLERAYSDFLMRKRDHTQDRLSVRSCSPGS